MDEAIKKIEIYGNTGYVIFKDRQGIFGFLERWEDNEKVSHVKIRLQECFNHKLGIRLQWRKLGKMSREWNKAIPSVALGVPELAKGTIAIIERLLKDITCDTTSDTETPRDESQAETKSDEVDKMMSEIGRV